MAAPLRTHAACALLLALQGRYKIMREYMPKVGSMGLDMMFRTCTVQARVPLPAAPGRVA
jgi:glutamate--cysteine ligase